MDYNLILKNIKPDKKEISKVKTLSQSMIQFINNLAVENGIKAQAILVGSVAKKTWLSGKADIDIFIHFPLDTSSQFLKEKGLFLGYECIEEMKGEAEERYASHPYVTGKIDGYEVDFVPCYYIKDAEDLKSAVDRTILHTLYINKHLQKEQINDVLLLKKFMECIETYGSEFKVGGFAGYLCELLVLEYGSFIEVLKAASSLWKKRLIIDLEKYGTGENFSDPLIVVDPTDKKRNVAAALNIQKMAEFIVASRNFLQNPEESYFKPVHRSTDKKSLQDQFQKRKTKNLLICFNPPQVPADAIYPQLKKTKNSLVTKMNDEGFEVTKSAYWSDETKLAFIILEFGVWELTTYKKHTGPEVWSKLHQERFLDKYGNKAWVEDNRWVVELERKNRTAESYLSHILKKENIHHLKIGKHLKKEILNNYEIIDINEFLKTSNCSNEILEFFDDYLNPGKNLWR